MSVLERTDHRYTRIYHEGESLASPWEPLCDPMITDELIIVEEEVRVHVPETSASDEVVEGIGWVMLPKVALDAFQEAAADGKLSGAGFYDLKAA